MMKTIFQFELRFQRRRPMFWISTVVFFLLGMALGSSDLGLEGTGTTLRNAPLAVFSVMPVLSLLGLFVVAAFASSAALRDFELGADALLFTKPISTADFLWGRLGGALVASLWVLSAGALGLAASNLAPWQTADRLGPIVPSAYGLGWLGILLPNLWIMGTLIFLLAVLSRRATVTYLGVVFFIGLQDLLEVVAEGTEGRLWGALLEPSGVSALASVSRYWTASERGVRLPDLLGTLGLNRVLWMLVASALLVWGFRRFRAGAPKGRRIRPRRRVDDSTRPGSASDLPVPVVAAPVPSAEGHRSAEGQGPKGRRGVTARTFTGSDTLRRLFKQARLEARSIYAGPAFWSAVTFALILLSVLSFEVGSHDGLPAHPTTSLMLEAIGALSRRFLPVLVVLFAGELMYGARARAMAQVGDTLPLPDAVFLGAKTLALISLPGVFVGAAMFLTGLLQGLRGAPQLIDPVLYLQGFGVLVWPMVPVAVLALSAQVLCGDKWLGYGVTAAMLGTAFVLPRLGFENPLYLWGAAPPVHLSDFNGYGHHGPGFGWLMLYWTAVSAILWTVSAAGWSRGPKGSLKGRLGQIGERFRGRGAAPALVGAAALVATLIATVVGAFVLYNTHVLNEPWTRPQLLDRLAAYEKAYKDYAGLPLPRITSVSSEVDLYPSEKRVLVRGRYHLVNPGPEPIRTIPVSRSPRWEEGVLRVYGGVSFHRLHSEGAETMLEDDDLGFYVLERTEPLMPGDETWLDFEIEVDHGAFTQRRSNDLLASNGTFFSNRNVFPVLGYARGQEIRQPVERRRRDLPEIKRAPSLDDPTAVRRNYLGADWIDVETVVSTSAEQIALAPGRLVEHREADGRNVFRFKSEAPMVDLFGIVSGRYETLRGTAVVAGEEVGIEVYLHPDHGFNGERFVDAARRTLEHLGRSLGPYPHGELRIVEVPSYHDKTAYSFAGFIAFSESWAYKADMSAVDDGEALDWLTAILAHEVAHQWWNHQVVPADAQGATLIAEALCQDAAMEILEAMYGRETAARFLEFHLDLYLGRRGHETVREMPLAQVENQGYIHYSKGSVALYRLRRELGSEVMDRALRSLIEAYRFGAPPYPTSRDLTAALRREAGSEHDELVDELFEEVVLYDLRTRRATARDLGDGRFEVRFEVEMSKWREDEDGTRHDLAPEATVELAVFDVEGELLTLETRRLSAANSEHILVVDREPARVGVDPLHLLIDVNGSDNVVPVDLTTP